MLNQFSFKLLHFSNEGLLILATTCSTVSASARGAEHQIKNASDGYVEIVCAYKLLYLWKDIAS